MRGGRARLTAKARDDLTPRQREVMDLLAAGKTNFEIAEALGITLEGAKYHVSEILARLGVESREEAVSVWSSGQPRRNWRRVVLGMGAAAAAAMVAVAAILALTGNGDDHPSSLEPGVWLAWVPHQSEDGKYPLQILYSSEPDKPVRVFDDQLYGLPAWSPDGRYLAVWVLDQADSSPALALFDTRDWSRRKLDLEGEGAGLLFWSPDSARLMLVRDGVWIITPSSGDHFEIEDVQRGELHVSTRGAWSPDSRRAVAMLGGALSVVTPNGPVTALEIPGAELEFAGAHRAELYWRDAESFTLVAFPEGGGRLGDLHRWVYAERNGRWEIVEELTSPAYPAGTVPGEPDATGYYQGRTADGSTDVFQTMRFRGTEPESEIWTTGEQVTQFILPVTGGGPSGGLGVWYDVLVVPR